MPWGSVQNNVISPVVGSAEPKYLIFVNFFILFFISYPGFLKEYFLIFQKFISTNDLYSMLEILPPVIKVTPQIVILTGRISGKID